jgi:ABC-2 type transport system ATP-binding protein
VQAVQIRALVRELGRDHAVVLSTHLLPDVLACCDRVAILHEGRLRYDGPLQRLAERALHVVTCVSLHAADWQAIDGVQDAQPLGAGWRVQLKDGALNERIAQDIVARGWGLRELRNEAANLEEIFLRIASAENAAAA